MINEAGHLTGWREWRSTLAGQSLYQQEYECLQYVAQRCHGRHLLQLGEYGDGSEGYPFEAVRSRVVLDLLSTSGVQLLSSPCSLPIATDSVSVVYLPHTLDLARDPHAVLREADRVLIPDGRLILSVFNPASLYGLWRLYLRNRGTLPWTGNFIRPNRLQDWLRLLGLEVESIHRLAFRPPLKNRKLYDRLSFMDSVMPRCCPRLAGSNLIVAVKRVFPLNLVGMNRHRRRRFVAGGIVEPTTRNNSSV